MAARPTPQLIAYAAHTQSCTYLLDAEGICRWVIARPGAKQGALELAHRCVGAQYVASLDPGAAGALVSDPRVGASMLFARSQGRITLMRTEPLTQFEVSAPGDEVPPTRRFEEEDTLRKRRDETDPPTLRRRGEAAAGDADDAAPTLRRVRRSMLPRVRPR